MGGGLVLCLPARDAEGASLGQLGRRLSDGAPRVVVAERRAQVQRVSCGAMPRTTRFGVGKRTREC